MSLNNGNGNHEYYEFLKRKHIEDLPNGYNKDFKIHPKLFPFQRDIVKWALRRGRAAIWADCGLGKTFISLEWARHIINETGKNILILAPLAVTAQTKREGNKLNIPVNICRTKFDVKDGINITNYEMLDRFDAKDFIGVVCDESGILKSLSGKIRTTLIRKFALTPYRLACTATPAPNDYMELGNHSEFLGVMRRTEMLSMFFNHDGGETSKWRLKGHAEDAYWKWLCSWAVMLKRPHDLGYEDEKGFNLPELFYEEHLIKTDKVSDGELFIKEAVTLNDQQRARRSTIIERAQFCGSLVNQSSDRWLVWCNLNDESTEISKSIKESVEVRGSHSLEYKESKLMDFAEGKIKCLISKPSICGHGLNFQNCHNVAFVGLSHSYEQLYQAVRRCWRFGQEHPVKVHIITSDIEGAVLRNIKRKEANAEKFVLNMIKQMHEFNVKNIKGTQKDITVYEPNLKMGVASWML